MTDLFVLLPNMLEPTRILANTQKVLKQTAHNRKRYNLFCFVSSGVSSQNQNLFSTFHPRTPQQQAALLAAGLDLGSHNTSVSRRLGDLRGIFNINQNPAAQQEPKKTIRTASFPENATFKHYMSLIYTTCIYT